MWNFVKGFGKVHDNEISLNIFLLTTSVTIRFNISMQKKIDNRKLKQLCVPSNTIELDISHIWNALA
jgi:hypothetical protein